MDVEKKVPEIRFQAVSGEWERTGLLDSIERIIDFRGRTPKKLGLDWSPSGYRALSALNVKQGYIDFSIDPHFGGQELYDKWMSDSELHLGQVLFTTEAPMGNVAQVPNSDKYILSQRTIAFVVNSEIVSEDFLAVLLRTQKVFKELTALSSGGTAKGVSQKTLAKLDISLPEDLSEQSQISNYFKSLDSLIRQHQQKHDKLSKIKKAMLEKMFPKQGETTPEIRFKGFSGEWEERHLSDVCWFQEGPGVRSHQFTVSGVKLFNGTNIEKGKVELGKTNRHISEDEAYGNYSHFLADAGDVVIACSGVTVSKFEEKVAVLSEEHLPLCMNTSTMRFKVKPSIMQRDYLVQILSSGLFKKQIGGSATGSAQLNFGPSHVSKVLAPLPSYEEQSAIGNYFQKFDSLINQYQQQITKLNNIKQACLRKMFV